MTKLSDFNLSELGIFIGVCSSALAALLLASQKSKCESICWGMCKRNVKAVIEEERLQITGRATPRGSLAEENKKVKQEIELELEVKEPETES